MLLCLRSLQRPGDVAAMALVVSSFHERDRALSLELGADQALHAQTDIGSILT